VFVCSTAVGEFVARLQGLSWVSAVIHSELSRMEKAIYFAA